MMTIPNDIYEDNDNTNNSERLKNLLINIMKSDIQKDWTIDELLMRSDRPPLDVLAREIVWHLIKTEIISLTPNRKLRLRIPEETKDA